VQQLRGAGFTDRELVDAGAAAPGQYGGVIDALRHRLVVPLIERGVDGGGVVGSTARRLSDADTAGPKWVNTATTALYRKSEHLSAPPSKPTSSPPAAAGRSSSKAPSTRSPSTSPGTSASPPTAPDSPPTTPPHSAR